jgi:D-alanine-D-alanine ligase
MKIGIFFGGASREREISFAGGRTVYDNLDKNLFEPVPIFVDSLGNFILLDWQYVYKGTIRDFYPPVQTLPESPNGFQIYIESLGDLSQEKMTEIASLVGTRIYPQDFKLYFEFAFLALHGPYGEDGTIQGIFEWVGIPYSGSGILPSSIGISKTSQKRLITQNDTKTYRSLVVNRTQWFGSNKGQLLSDIQAKVGPEFVVKAPNQGSSIGITLLSSPSEEELESAMLKSFFIERMTKDHWTNLQFDQKTTWIRELTDIKVGIGLPVYHGDKKIFHPEDLFSYLNEYFISHSEDVLLENPDGEYEVLIESKLSGKEFSCIVIQDPNGNPIALPPTEIVKKSELYDYRSKYLPGMSHKVTPINLPEEKIEEIRKACSRLYADLLFNVYARIDGFITGSGEIFLNDPNTTSGMMPSSFFFHQAAEIGLNPSQFLTYMVRTSLAERLRSGKNSHMISRLLEGLDLEIEKHRDTTAVKTRVAVIMGGYSSERHISVESGRNVFEKLASSTKYKPFPVFLTGSSENIELYEIPVNIMLKDNADDIKENILKALEGKKHPILEKIIEEAKGVTNTYVGSATFQPQKLTMAQLAKKAEQVFIALHGRPGEDGMLQKELEKVGLTYNGSSIASSQITINKYDTNELLAKNGIRVARHAMVYKADWEANKEDFYLAIERDFTYPFIAKPADDGCSSAVKKIKSREELQAFSHLMFREQEEKEPNWAHVLQLKTNEEFPQKTGFLIETLIEQSNADHFLEVTGGLLTKYDGSRERVYEMFEASETLASGGILSLEEKFLAGEGQNITPARYAKDKSTRQKISDKVKADLKKTAEVLNIEGYCRIDAFVHIYEDDSVETTIIEVNSLPGMTPATCIFHQCALNGYKPYEFIDAILVYGKERK